MSKMWRTYGIIVSKYPMVSQAVQAGTLMGIGDAISQCLIERKPVRQLDLKRLLQFTSVGLLVVGPTLRLWYGFLNQRFGSAGTRTALKKVACDQLLFAPGFIFVIVNSIGIAKGEDLGKINRNVRENYFDILINNYKLWPAVQVMNFYFVPLRDQVLVTQLVAVLWNSYLSWKTNAKKSSEELNA